MPTACVGHATQSGQGGLVATSADMRFEQLNHRQGTKQGATDEHVCLA
jgi:hypothetical protein